MKKIIQNFDLSSLRRNRKYRLSPNATPPPPPKEEQLPKTKVVAVGSSSPGETPEDQEEEEEEEELPAAASVAMTRRRKDRSSFRKITKMFEKKKRPTQGSAGLPKIEVSTEEDRRRKKRSKSCRPSSE